MNINLNDIAFPYDYFRILSSWNKIIIFKSGDENNIHHSFLTNIFLNTGVQNCVL